MTADTTPVPDEAITLAAKALHNTVFNAELGGYSACACTDRDEHDEKWHTAVVDARRALGAAAPAIREQERGQFRSERDLMHADLGDLLEATAQGNYARPESSHDVMRQAIARVLEIRAVCKDAVKLTVSQGNRIAELEQRQPMRGDATETWLKRRRDEHPERSAAWIALDDALDDYRLHADCGAPLHAEAGSLTGDDRD